MTPTYEELIAALRVVGPFSVACGDAAHRTNPGAGLTVNTSKCWVVGEDDRSKVRLHPNSLPTPSPHSEGRKDGPPALALPPLRLSTMSRADELKVLTDSIERIAAMAPPLHLRYTDHSYWYADQKRRTDALQAEVTKLLSTQPEPAKA